ncbi:MAG: sensor histidine kinase [Planctomycetota bacterium]
MRRSIQTQILLPFSATIVVAVTVIAATSSWLAVRQTEQRTLAQLHGVGDTLNRLSVPFTASVLTPMKGLSGADFIALDGSGRSSATTLTEVSPRSIERLTDLIPLTPSDTNRSISEFPVVEVQQTRYLADRVRVSGSAAVETLIVLFPEADWQKARWAAFWPPLAVGAVTVIAVMAISAALARGFGRRIRTVQELLAALAAGDPCRVQGPPAPRDELDDLVASASHLASELERLQSTVQHTERVRLLGQLAGGLAHQLRNAVTGARLAVQLHQKRCDGQKPGQLSDQQSTDDESLDVALRQLSLTEDQIQRLLSLSRQETPTTASQTLPDLIDEIDRLIRPHADHARVELTVHSTAESDKNIADAERFRSAIMNLLLNAIEAAGSGGHVWLEIQSVNSGHVITVSDDGPGPPADVADALFDPFVTSKPEGIGLGLALAKQVAQDLGGDLTWDRDQERTVFTFLLPETSGVS